MLLRTHKHDTNHAKLSNTDPFDHHWATLTHAVGSTLQGRTAVSVMQLLIMNDPGDLCLLIVVDSSIQVSLIDKRVDMLPDLVQSKRSASVTLQLVDVDPLLCQLVVLDEGGDVLHQLALGDWEVAILPRSTHSSALVVVRVRVVDRRLDITTRLSANASKLEGKRARQLGSCETGVNG